MRLVILLNFLPYLAFGQPFDGYVPPGTIHISGNLFIDATEVSNAYWREFERYTNLSHNPKYAPFTEVNQEVTEKYRFNYYLNPEYKFHPVVGITQKQASKFCEWRTEVINAKLREMYNHNALTNLFDVRYRLPSEQEWILSTTLIDTVALTKPLHYYVETFLDSKNETALKIKLGSDSLSYGQVKRLLKLHKKNDLIPAFKVQYKRPVFAVIEDQLPANTFFPLWDGNNLFNPDLEKPLNLIGNVAELVKEPGIVKGGSWRHQLAVSFPSKQIQIDSKKVYDWVGFRCICEVWEIQ